MANANPTPRPVDVLLDAAPRKSHKIVRGILNGQGRGCAADNRSNAFGFGSIQTGYPVLSRRILPDFTRLQPAMRQKSFPPFGRGVKSWQGVIFHDESVSLQARGANY
jgi:hypothetical protein